MNVFVVIVLDATTGQRKVAAFEHQDIAEGTIATWAQQRGVQLEVVDGESNDGMDVAKKWRSLDGGVVVVMLELEVIQ